MSESRRRTAVTYYVGLDVSLEQTAVCIIDEAGDVVAERTVASHPDDIGECVAGVTGTIARVGLEAGPLAPWLYSGLAERGLPVHCIEVRQMKAFARASPVKTDRRDARLIAQAMRTGLFKATHVKTDYSQRIRLLLRHRQSMVRRNKDLINTVRGPLKAFGIRTGDGKNTLYARRVREAIDDPMLLAMTEPLLAAYEDAANVMLTRCRADNWLKSWAFGIARRRGARKAKVALARRLAVVMHRMWIDGTEFSMERPATMTA